MNTKFLLLISLLVVKVLCKVGPYNIDTSAISVSGLSAGAFFTVQYSVAFSSEIMGAAAFAGGPYYCAQDELYIGLSQCMYTDIGLNIDTLVSDAQSFSSNGAIDNIANVTRQKLFVYSGSDDTIVVQAVVKDLVDFYNLVGVPSDNLQTKFDLQAEHSMPTTDYGNSCDYLGSPYINNCNFDGAGTALQWIYGQLKSPVTPNNNVLSFSQAPFVPNGQTPESISMGPNAYLYVPSACNSTSVSCKLHVVFHGCQQTIDDINEDYILHTGYNKWAEANNIIVLYPQVIKIEGTNPEGCFDWWGYTDSNYAVKAGVQMTTVYNMMHYIIGN